MKIFSDGLGRLRHGLLETLVFLALAALIVGVLVGLFLYPAIYGTQTWTQASDFDLRFDEETIREIKEMENSMGNRTPLDMSAFDGTVPEGDIYFRLANEEREARKIRPLLKQDATLYSLAWRRANYFCDHPYEMDAVYGTVERFGTISVSIQTVFGENPGDAHAALMFSADRKENILNPDHRRFGSAEICGNLVEFFSE